MMLKEMKQRKMSVMTVGRMSPLVAALMLMVATRYDPH
jgi:hypothetical protein